MKEVKGRSLTGVVLSDKMDKTIIVITERLVKDARFYKYVKKKKKYKVHDSSSEAKIGDVVEFYEGRPVSKDKFMYLKRVIKPAV